ncbi:MAG: mechanosensitive ion channel [Planctomycetaceae bacterium]
MSETTTTEEKQTPAEVLARVDELVRQITSNTEADEATKTEADKLKQQIQASLDDWKKQWELNNKYQQDIKTTPTEAQKLKDTKDQLQNGPPRDFSQITSAAELEQELNTAKARLETLQKETAALTQEASKRLTARQEIPAQLEKLSEEEAALTNTLQTDQVTVTSPPLEQLRRLDQQSLRVRINQRRKALESQIQLYDIQQTVDWLQLKTELTELQLTKTQEQVKTLTEEFQIARQREAAKAVKEAETQNEQALLKYPGMKLILNQYRDWAVENQQVIKELTNAENTLTNHKIRLDELNKQYERVTLLVEQVGHTGPIGIMLRKLKTEIRDVDDMIKQIQDRNETLADIPLKIFKMQEERSLMLQPDQLVQKIMPNASQDDQKRALEAIRKQREIHKTLRHNKEEYNTVLLELNTTDKAFIAKQQEFISYIDERVLWIRSSTNSALSFKDLRKEADIFTWLFNWDSWKQVWTQTIGRIRQAPWLSVALILLWSFLLVMGTRWRRDLAAISKQITPSAYYKFFPTVKATILSLLIAVVWPLFFWGWAWQLEQQPDLNGFPEKIVPALYQIGYWFFALEFIRLLFRSKGLADSHFQWNFASMLTVRRNIRWLMAFSVPLLLAFGLLRGFESEVENDPVNFNQANSEQITPQDQAAIDELNSNITTDTGTVDATLQTDLTSVEYDAWQRVAYILFLACVTIFLFNIFRPSSGLFQTVIDYKQNAWMDRLRGPTCLVIVAIPATLMLLSFMGFHYTSLQLSGFFVKTAWFLLALFVIRALLLRWIMLGYRRLSIQRAQQKREQREAEKLAQEQSDEKQSAESPIKIEEDRPIDLRFSSHQIRRLLNATLWTIAFCGLWLIWTEMIPALSLLDSSERFAIWHTTTEQTDPDTNNTIVIREPVTIFDLVLGFAIALLTVAATRNIPGLLEMTVLEQLPIDASIRYAITTIARYVCILIGVIVGFQVIGLAWSQVQWMATALTFGLAFGLQEIFANFISGIILLFERPIRVGDVVTIDSVSGVVSRIRMRATTITDWDRKEYVVPNKEFITGRLLNWTLTDPINRIVIEVGIAYGSDIERARNIILQLATSHPETLEDPPPVVTFDRFGDSALNLTLRAYLPSLENRLLTLHQLHLQINNEFNAAGIEISFPQRDLHIRSMPKEFFRDHSSSSSSNGNGNGNGKSHEENGHSKPEPPTEPASALTLNPADDESFSSKQVTDPGLDE